MVFDQLVASISLEERQNLLQKLKSRSSISNEILYFDDKGTVPAGDIETEFALLPWYSRLWYFFISFFKAKPPLIIFGDYRVAALGQKIEDRSPGLYDYQRRMLLAAFCQHIEALKEAARFFYSALDTSVNRDKGAFFAFLGSLEMADIHKQLEADTEPAAIAENHSDMPETELRQIAFKIMDSTLGLINEEQRDIMYFAARSLNCLKGLSSFLFDRLIMAFTAKGEQAGATCSVNVVKEQLASLNNILLSLKVVPPMALLESLFVFNLQDRAGESGFDINREMHLLLAKAEGSLNVIKEFNKKVPLAWIIRCATRNMSFAPNEISGGEDWFLVYRDYWRRCIEAKFADYFRDRRRKGLLDAFHYFLKGHEVKPLENTQSDSNPAGLPVKGAFSLSFLLTFYSAVFIPTINKVLKPILIDGEFYKKENRVEFTEGYNTLIKLEDEIKKFEQDISPSGEYGKRYAQARKDMSALPVKRRKMQIVLEDAQEDAETIIDHVRGACRSMVSLLSGFIGHDTKGKYDILNNLSAIAGRNSEYTGGLNETVKQFQILGKLLDDIEATEDIR
ncbi:MAG: DUF5312 domain-containing protein [Treponema sp.]|nr:DUF5312 domain-containing protein [Treponema sp.]